MKANGGGRWNFDETLMKITRIVSALPTMCEFHQIFIPQQTRRKVNENECEIMKINDSTYDGVEKGVKTKKLCYLRKNLSHFVRLFLSLALSAISRLWSKFISLSSFTHTQLSLSFPIIIHRSIKKQ